MEDPWQAFYQINLDAQKREKADLTFDSPVLINIISF